jgi:hypothetical protein
MRVGIFLFSKIISYELKINPPDRKVPLGLIVAGVILLVVGIGIIFLINGIWLWSQQQSEYWIVFETKEITRDVVYQTKNFEEAKEIKGTLDIAIAKYLDL